VRFSTPSLRAQRGNPDFGAAGGLLRHFVPRNDEHLRAFASLRDTNLFLFSRKGAKAQRKGSIYGPGSNFVECAADVLRLLGLNMPPVGMTEETR
jgi:hypothetical protein